jgi:surfactin synthase thioesterase subunit
MRLVCFPSLGVGASLFTPFLMDSSIGLEPFALQTPGHETRRSEPLLTSLSDLMAGVMTTILSLMDRPCYSGAMALGVLLHSRLYVLSSVLISPCPAILS